MKKRKIVKFIIYIYICVLLLDFIPIKFARKETEIEGVFINQPKLGDGIEWAKCNAENSIIAGYIIEGESPSNVLNKKEFNKIDLYLMRGNHTNKFLITYENIITANESDVFPVYKILATDWDILYPINRTSFRRFYAPRTYLTIYDYNWTEGIKRILQR